MIVTIHESFYLPQAQPPKPTATATVFGKKENYGGGAEEDESIAEVSISEEIIEDDFAESSDNRDGGGSTEEQLTRDESVSAGASVAADYKEKF